MHSFSRVATIIDDKESVLAIQLEKVKDSSSESFVGLHAWNSIIVYLKMESVSEHVP